MRPLLFFVCSNIKVFFLKIKFSKSIERSIRHSIHLNAACPRQFHNRKQIKKLWNEFTLSSGELSLPRNEFTLSSGELILPLSEFILPLSEFILPPSEFTLPRNELTLSSDEFILSGNELILSSGEFILR